MDFTEKKVRSDYKFYGKIINVRVDDALLPNGKPCKREVCEHVGGVGILPIDENRMVTLVRQYRYPYETTTLEIPAGKMDQGPEEALECGRRELEEETGLRAGQMIPMGELWPSPGFMTERLCTRTTTNLSKSCACRLTSCASASCRVKSTTRRRSRRSARRC